MVLIWRGKGQHPKPGRVWGELGRMDGGSSCIDSLTLEEDQIKVLRLQNQVSASSTQTLIPRVHGVGRAQRPRSPDEEEKFNFFLSSLTEVGRKQGRSFHVSPIFHCLNTGRVQIYSESR